MSIADSERLPKESTGHGRNEHVAASKHRGGDSTEKERKDSENLTGQGGHTTSEIGNSLAGPGRRRLGLKSQRPGRAWARDLEKSWARPGAGVGPARLGPTSSVGPIRKYRWIS